MVIITFRNKRFEVKENMTARDALKRLNIDPESVLITVNGKLVTDDIVLREGDEVKLVAVISGGQDSPDYCISILDWERRNQER